MKMYGVSRCRARRIRVARERVEDRAAEVDGLGPGATPPKRDRALVSANPYFKMRVMPSAIPFAVWSGVCCPVKQRSS